jgi:phosphatidate phosphatase PAH1
MTAEEYDDYVTRVNCLEDHFFPPVDTKGKA